MTDITYILREYRSLGPRPYKLHDVPLSSCPATSCGRRDRCQTACGRLGDRTEGFCKLGVVKLFAPIEHASFMSEAAALSASGSVVRVHHTDQTERV